MYQKLDQFKLPMGFRGKNVLLVQLWWFTQASFFSLSPQFMYRWRNFLLRCFGAEIGKGVIIRPTVRITYPWKLKVGDYSWIGDDVNLYTLGEIILGKNVVVSQKCYLCTGSHDYSSEDFAIFAKPILIEDQAWVATDVFVAPGVTIGRGAVVGARSSVYRDIPKGMVCIGNPAKPIKPRKGDDIIPIQP